MDVEIWGTVQKLKKKGKIFRRNETQPNKQINCLFSGDILVH